MSKTARPISAARLAEQLGDRMPTVDSLPAESFDLVDATRSLIEAVVMTDVDPEDRASAAETIHSVISKLTAVRREEPLLLARRDGLCGVESLLQAGTGRLNPQAPPVEWTERPVEPEPGGVPVPATVRAICRFTAAHAGSPGRVHGGVIATVLDEALGHAVTCSGVSGMTVSFTLSLRRATPLDEPVEIVARYNGHEGRKSFATGEVVVDGMVTAEASAIFVSERRHA
jgi:acyl-coenzyme A thioesterase PaaI-like protein